VTRLSEPQFVSPFKPGELIVHITHGLSRYVGTRLLRADDGSTAEYFQLDYANGDRVFVPVAQIARLSKHLGSGEILARLVAAVNSRTPFSRHQKPTAR
jgi:transcription-repair coupling factor (superfamily II helicase)